MRQEDGGLHDRLGGTRAGKVDLCGKKSLVIPLDEVVAGRYDESVQNKISIISQTLGFLS